MDNNRLDEVVVSPQDAAAVDEIAAYWTEERMASAIPLPFPTLPSSASTSRFGGAAGGPVSGNSLPPDNDLDPLAGCFTTSQVANLNVFPYQAVGKLYMEIGGQYWVGSAWVVGESTICTAGHCIYNQEWATNVLFAARFNYDTAIGRWAIGLKAAPRGWTDNRNFEYDLGFGIADQPIRPTTGKLGWMANYPANQGRYAEIGYPADAIPGFPFDGGRMWESLGNYIDGTSIIGACGNLTAGASGGPWAVFKENQWRGNGINSHRYGDPNRLYSPYFGQAFVNLINWMRSNGGDN